MKKNKLPKSKQLTSELEVVKKVVVVGPVTDHDLLERIQISNQETKCFISGKKLTAPTKELGNVAWHKFCNDENAPVRVMYNALEVVVAQKFVQMPYLIKEILMGNGREMVLI